MTTEKKLSKTYDGKPEAVVAPCSHKYVAASDPYHKIGDEPGIDDRHLAYVTLFCEKCAGTTEIKAQDRRRQTE